MRKLATNEFRLLIFFCAAIFLAANLFAVRAWAGARASLFRDLEVARGKVAENRMWLDGATGIASSHKWIEAHPAQTNTAEQASAGLLKTTRSAAEEAGLKIIEENRLDKNGIEQLAQDRFGKAQAGTIEDHCISL